MRMLRAVLWHQRRSLHAISKQVLPKVQDALRQLRRALLAALVAVARPHELRERSGARPDLLADDSVVDLLTEQGGDGALNEGLLRVGQVEGEVIVVDALPGLVGCAPGTALAAPVEVEDGGIVRVGVDEDVVARVVGDVAAVAAVEVDEI